MNRLACIGGGAPGTLLRARRRLARISPPAGPERVSCRVRRVTVAGAAYQAVQCYGRSAALAAEPAPPTISIEV